MTQPFIGIDFGTCNSSAAWFNPKTGQAELLQNAEGEDKTPSVVYFGPKNETVVGKHAEDQLESPEGRKRVLSAVKRDLAKQTARVVGGRRVTPLEAAALILGKINRDAEKRHFQEPVTRAVITCPVVFDEVEKDKLREAATLAGFRDVRLLEEPVAAASAYAENGIKVGRCVLVYDLGGGTFDLALLIREEGEDVFRPAMEPRGERIGGENFDRAIYDHFDAIIRKKTEQPICPDGLDLHLLRQCRKLKESLTDIVEPAPLTWYWPGKCRLELKLNRARFESLVENYVERTVRLTRSIQQDAAKAGFQLDSVILIGGSSRTPCIVRRLQETLQVEPTEWQKQYVAVALGAAYHGQRLWGEKPSPPPPPESFSSGNKPAMASSAANSDSEFDLAIDEESPPEKAAEEKDIFETDLGLVFDLLGVNRRAHVGEAFPARPQIASDEIVSVQFSLDCENHAFLSPTLFKVIFDNVSLYRKDGGDFWNLSEGCYFSFKTTRGDHILQVAYDSAWGARGISFLNDLARWKPKNTKTYTVSFREGGSYRITIQVKSSGFLSVNHSFADEVQQVKIG
jgi:hypothetical protein